MPIPETVMTSHASFEEFLQQQDYKLWRLDGGGSFASWMTSPSTLEDVMTRIQEMSAGEDMVYVFSELGDDGEYGAAMRTDWSNVPEVGAADLRDYIVTTVDGADFLYFVCSPEAGSSGSCITLLPGREPEQEQDNTGDGE